MTPLPVGFVKDTAAACVAELVAGRGRSIGSFLYVFIDTFIGGGLVIDSQLRGGLNGNAGAIGSLSLGLAKGTRAPEQLLSQASMITLEAAFEEAGLDAGASLDDRALQTPWRPHTERWLRDASPSIAFAAHSAACLLDLDGVIIDGSFSRELLAATILAVNRSLDRFD